MRVIPSVARDLGVCPAAEPQMVDAETKPPRHTRNLYPFKYGSISLNAGDADDRISS